MRFNLCGNRQLSDVLNLSANGGAITTGATPAITQVSGYDYALKLVGKNWYLHPKGEGMKKIQKHELLALTYK